MLQGRSYGYCHAENLDAAVEAVRTNQMYNRKIVIRYNMKRSTLHDIIEKHKKPDNRFHLGTQYVNIPMTMK